jgi:hypothetical protein
LPPTGSPFFPQEATQAWQGAGVDHPEDSQVQDEAGKGPHMPPSSISKEEKEAKDGKALAAEEKVHPLPPSPSQSPVKETVKGTATAATSIAMAAQEQVQALRVDPLQNLASFQKLRACLPWWEKYAPRFVVQLIKQGVEPTFQGHHLTVREQQKSAQECDLGMEVMKEYLQIGAAREVSSKDTKYLVPWFVITKQEGEKVKHRLISDCRQLNLALSPPKFRLDHWKDIFPVLEPHMWATKIDLQHAYFHLALSENIKKFVRMKIGNRVFQMEAACFGLSSLPYLWMQVMHVFLKKWRAQGLQVFIYLDDILLLAKSKTLAEKQTSQMVKDLSDRGMMINPKTFNLEPCEELEHLGFLLNLKEGVLQVPTHNRKVSEKNWESSW